MDFFIPTTLYNTVQIDFCLYPKKSKILEGSGYLMM